MAKTIAEMTDAERELFKQGFLTGWYECVGNTEKDKDKLKAIAVAAADNYINLAKR